MLHNCNTIKVARVFFLEPSKEHYLKEISRKSKLAHTSVKKILGSLKEEKIIYEQMYKKGNRKFPVYYSNTKEGKFTIFKKVYNLEFLLNSGVIDYLKKKTMPNCIVLFGSYLKGEDTEDSDIDLFVESKQEQLFLKKFENFLGRSIQIHFKEDFNDYNFEIRNNILNGYVVYGFLEAFK